jgi:hypothetical protein
MGRAYWAAAAIIGIGALAAGAAIAGGDGPEAVATVAAAPATDEGAAVERCFARVQRRLMGRGAAGVMLAELGRAWPGSEGWIVELTVDEAREDGALRRRAFTCRQGEHGLHVTRG